MADAVAIEAPELRAGCIALVDSPRAPRDFDSRSMKHLGYEPGSRDIDASLRRLVRQFNGTRPARPAIKLSMFPTPLLDYFKQCAADSGCKPHLAAIAREVLEVSPPTIRDDQRSRKGGWLFTRFMLAGFAVYRALKLTGVESFESYPYLAFSLWKNPKESLPPKSDRDALLSRKRILKRIGEQNRMVDLPEPATLDQADAAVLAVTAAVSALRCDHVSIVSGPMGGEFMIPMNAEFD